MRLKLLLAVGGFVDVSVSAVCMPRQPNGITWFKGENNGSDSLGTNNGTMQNGADFATGIIGSGFRFDADNEHLLVPFSPSLNIGTSGSITLETWVQTDFAESGRQRLRTDF